MTLGDGMRGDGVEAAHPLFPEEGGGAIPTSPLQLVIKECNVHLACALNAKWHSSVPLIKWTNIVRNKIHMCFTAEAFGEPFAVAIWSTPTAANRLKDGWNKLELRRFAIAPTAPRNTASRMLAVMTRKIRRAHSHLVMLISYQDTLAHTGTIYKAAGWKNAGVNYKGPAGEWGETRDQSSYERKPPQSLAPKVRWELQLNLNETVVR